MGKFDRELQKEILTACIEAYPEHTSWELCSQFATSCDNEILSANIIYLAEHDLISIRNRTSDDPYSFLDNMRATASGVDFMLNDGGLSAILNVQTIKLHRDTVVVLEDLIALSGLSDSEKEKAKSKLSEMTDEALKTVVQTAISAGLSLLMK